MRLPNCLLPFVSNAPNGSILGAFIALWIATESIRDGQSEDSWLPSGTPAHLAFVEAIKLAISLMVYFWKRPDTRSGGYNGVAQDEERDLGELSPELRLLESPALSSPEDPSWSSLPRVSLPFAATRSNIPIVALAFIYTCRGYLISTAETSADPFTLYIAVAVSTLFTLALLRLFLLRSFVSLQWHAVLLQCCGLFIVRSSIATPLLLESPLSFLIGLALFTSFAFVLSDHMYKLNVSSSFNTFNIMLFVSGLVMHLFIFIIHGISRTSTSVQASHWSLRAASLPFAEACRDIATLSVIFYFDAATAGLMATLASALLLFVTAAWSMSHYTGIYAGCALVFLASDSYMRSQKDNDEVPDVNRKSDPRRRIAAAAAVFSLSVYMVYTSIRSGLLSSPDYSPSLSYILTNPYCPRKPLPDTSNVTRTRKRTYHVFDDVLLIVFFSHARYDGNLDYYREVYAEYFPNILFIGPGSREDAGFSHSYDVLVDSYQADEDLSDPTFYKMAGRMAHHMLYTAMHEHPCYSGYLWAPFDTLLNVPRLQQFDQSRFWYHSPWAHYVPNPAFEDEVSSMNKTRHAPAANISPDPALNATEGWRGWGLDWWWGDPHVGLSVCMRAFNKAPLSMRNRLASFTNGTTRLIGGSADTVYIPGKYRDTFLDILGQFLETDCFLEIATPTALHLVVPENEEILFVDHWWIWQPPFNATFVRNQWAQGFEVDTFHTFHWGDVDANDLWRPNPDNIADVRILLQESAKRQGVEWRLF